MSKLEDSIRPQIKLILDGHILSIDPSSGSRNSLPGYAIYKAGELVDSGVIQVPVGDNLHTRLFHLRKSMMEDFEKPDILVTENVPPVMQSKGFFNKSVLSLQKAIGVVISCFDVPLIEVAPISWRQNIPATYQKTDENDAILMGYTVVKLAHIYAAKPVPVLKDLKGKTTKSIEGIIIDV